MEAVNSASANIPDRFQKTSISGDLYNFENYASFDEYILKYRSYIAQFRPNLTELEISNLAPLTIRKIADPCIKKTGILLVHGLGDSPFLMSDLALDIATNQNCVVIKSLILPGNGLVPGASLEVGYQDWIRVIDFTISDFKNENVNQIIAIGLSTGSTLILNRVLNNNPNIIAAAFFSPAFDIGLSRSKILQLKIIDFVSNFKPLNFLAYYRKYGDANIYKYESYSYHSINDLYNLIKINNALLQKVNSIKVPTFFAFSDVDVTVKAKTTIALINKIFINARGVVFSNDGININPAITILKPADLPNKILDLSHGSIAISGDNYFYGKNAQVNHGCLQYDTKTTQDEFNSCKSFDPKFYYGETTKYNNKTYKYVSRITYNPYYQTVFTKLNDFINEVRKTYENSNYL